MLEITVTSHMVTKVKKSKDNMLPIYSSSSNFGPHWHPKKIAHGFFVCNLFCGRIVFHTLFGLIKNFWVALATRFLLGGFNGMHGAVKANLDLSSYVVEGKKWISFSQNFVSSALSCGTVLQQTKKNLFQCMQKWFSGHADIICPGLYHLWSFTDVAGSHGAGIYIRN